MHSAVNARKSHQNNFWLPETFADRKVVFTYLRCLALIISWSRLECQKESTHYTCIKGVLYVVYLTWLYPYWVDTGVDCVPILVPQAVVALFVGQAVPRPVLPFRLTQRTRNGSHFVFDDTCESP